MTFVLRGGSRDNLMKARFGALQQFAKTLQLGRDGLLHRAAQGLLERRKPDFTRAAAAAANAPAPKE